MPTETHPTEDRYKGSTPRGQPSRTGKLIASPPFLPRVLPGFLVFKFFEAIFFLSYSDPAKDFSPSSRRIPLGVSSPRLSRGFQSRAPARRDADFFPLL